VKTLSRIGFAVLFVAGCNRDQPSPNKAAPSAAPAAAPASGTDGGGDGSGAGLANARALKSGSPVTLTLTCSAKVWFGPFALTKDPQKLLIDGKMKTPTGKQICMGGEFTDKTGAHVGGTSFGCADGTHGAEGTSTYEYSPGNGGSGATPVYLALAFGEPKPEGCPSAEVTLSLK